MATYAKHEDVQKRLLRELTESEKTLCTTLLEDAAVLIDRRAPGATHSAKKVVSCRMVVRALGTGELNIPIGASQGSQSALGYSESWTMSGGGIGELYLSKADKEMLGVGNAIGSYSPLQGISDKGGGCE